MSDKKPPSGPLLLLPTHVLWQIERGVMRQPGSLPVRITLREGPVRVPSLGQKGVNATHQLWDGIEGTEFFPPNERTAFYNLSLAKGASTALAVAQVEGELMGALQLIAAAWPFAGGSFVALDLRETSTLPRVESNAAEVRQEFIAKGFPLPVSVTTEMGYESLASYSQAPLAAASQIAEAAHHTPRLRRLLQYHQSAWLRYYHRERDDRVGWFIDLYKVRDFLSAIYGNDETAIATLGTTQAAWSHFGRVLNNNDLRHAELDDVVPSLSRSEVDRLFQSAREWVTSYLRSLGLPAV